MAKQTLATFGMMPSAATQKRARKEYALLATANNERRLKMIRPTDIVVAAIDNCGKQSGHQFVNTVQIFIWTVPTPTAIEDIDALKREFTGSLSKDDESKIKRGNPIYGDGALKEEAQVLGLVKDHRIVPIELDDEPRWAGDEAAEPPIVLEPITGNVSDGTIRDALNSIAKAVKISVGQREFVYLVCDQDIYELVHSIMKQGRETFSWIRPLPAEWHVSLCMRLTIGATWGKSFVAKMVEEVESMTANTARYLVSGARWRRSGRIFFQAARGATRFLLTRWKQESGGAPFDAEVFRTWLDAARERSAAIKHITDFCHAVGINLLLDLAMRDGNMELAIICATDFHALACSRGRWNYKIVIGDQVISWEEADAVERAVLEQATFVLAQNGKKIARDEAYEAVIKGIKAQMSPHLLGRPEHITYSVQLATVYQHLQARTSAMLDFMLERGKKARSSSRPQTAGPDDLEKIAQYHQWLEAYVQEFERTGVLKTPDGAFKPVYLSWKPNKTLGAAEINLKVNSSFEEGRTESTAYLKARFERKNEPERRKRACPVVIGTKKDRQTEKAKRMRQDLKEQKKEINEKDRANKFLALRNKVLAKEKVMEEDMDGLTRAELEEALGRKVSKHKRKDEVKELLKKAHLAEGEEEEEPIDEGSDEDESVSNLVIRLRRTPSGNHWEHAQPREEADAQDTE